MTWPHNVAPISREVLSPCTAITNDSEPTSLGSYSLYQFWVWYAASINKPASIYLCTPRGESTYHYKEKKTDFCWVEAISQLPHPQVPKQQQKKQPKLFLRSWVILFPLKPHICFEIEWHLLCMSIVMSHFWATAMLSEEEKLHNLNQSQALNASSSRQELQSLPLPRWGNILPGVLRSL